MLWFFCCLAFFSLPSQNMISASMINIICLIHNDFSLDKIRISDADAFAFFHKSAFLSFQRFHTFRWSFLEFIMKISRFHFHNFSHFMFVSDRMTITGFPKNSLNQHWKLGKKISNEGIFYLCSSSSKYCISINKQQKNPHVIYFYKKNVNSAWQK